MEEEFVWEAEESHCGVLCLVLVLTKVVVGGESVAGAVGDSSLDDTYGTRTQRDLYVQNRDLQYWPRHKKGRRNLSCHNVQVFVDRMHCRRPLLSSQSETKYPEKEHSFPDRE